MPLKSSLISGAGNTFHIFYNVNGLLSAPDLVKKICQKFPADGVVFLRQPTAGQTFYSWDFYNKDGSVAEMCGNAVRCAGYYIENILALADRKFELMTTAGLIQIQILGHHQYQVGMTKAFITPHKKWFACNTGVPHVVIEIPSADNYDQHKVMTKDLRSHADFPMGTNVTLIKLTSNKNNIQAVSYERGVEDFTLACGTGAVAAALYMDIKYDRKQTNIEMPGGKLTVDMTNRDQPLMTGPAKHLKDCIYELNT